MIERRESPYGTLSGISPNRSQSSLLKCDICTSVLVSVMEGRGQNLSSQALILIVLYRETWVASRCIYLAELQTLHVPLLRHLNRLHGTIVGSVGRLLFNTPVLGSKPGFLSMLDHKATMLIFELVVKS